MGEPEIPEFTIQESDSSEDDLLVMDSKKSELAEEEEEESEVDCMSPSPTPGPMNDPKDGQQKKIKSRLTLA